MNGPDHVGEITVQNLRKYESPDIAIIVYYKHNI